MRLLIRWLIMVIAVAAAVWLIPGVVSFLLSLLFPDKKGD
jgi:hypothetical protein